MSPGRRPEHQAWGVRFVAIALMATAGACVTLAIILTVLGLGNR